MSCCLSLYFGLHGSYTTEKHPLFAVTAHNKRDVVMSPSGCFFCLSFHHMNVFTQLLILLPVSWLCVKTQKLTWEVDVKCALSHKESGSLLHFVKFSKPGSVFESQFQWCYWCTIRVCNRNVGERIYDSSQISSSNVGWHQALFHSVLFWWCGGGLVGVYTCK